MIETSKSRLRWAAQILLLLAWAAAALLYFLYKVPQFWEVGWTNDDLMNAYRGMETPYASIAKDLLCFWRPTPLYRPLGELFYKVIFDFSGWNPMPWRYASLLLFLGNSLLVGHVARRVSGSVAAGLAATAVAMYHPHWIYLYFNTGTIFEILAFACVWGGIAVYLEAYEHGWQDRYWLLALLGVVYIAGLNAKESAITLPAFLVLYEGVVKRRIPWRLIVLLGSISLAFIAGRVYGPEGLSSVGNYTPSYSVAMYLERFSFYFGHLIVWKSVPLWAAGVFSALPLLLRSGQAVWVACLFPVGILPLAFVPQRGLDGVYIACAALPLCAALLVAAFPKEWLRLLAAALLFLGLYWWMPPILGRGCERECQEIEAFHRSLLVLAPTMPKGVQIRFQSEPFNQDSEWASTFITRLAYRDPSIVVVAPHNPHTKNRSPEKDFMVFDWRTTMLVTVKANPLK